MKEGYKISEVGVIPEDWEVGTFEDIMTLRKESFNPLNEENERYIGLEHIEESSGRLLGVGNSDETSSIKNKFYEGDILFGKLRPYLKKYHIATFDGVCVTEILTLRSKNSDNKFCFYSIQQDKFIEYINNKTFGTKMPRTSWNEMKDYLIGRPPLKEQEKIAEILSTVDTQIDDTEKLIEKCRVLKKGLMQRLLTKGIGHSQFKKSEVGEIPVGWEVKKLNDVSERVCVGFVGTCNKHYTIDDKNKVPMIRTTNMSRGELNLNDVKYVTEEFHKNNSKSQLRYGDILVARHGENGKATLFDLHCEANCLNIVVIRPNSNIINSKFLLEIMNSMIVAKQINLATVGSVQSVLNTTTISKLNILLPTIEEQVKIGEILSSVDFEIKECENKKQNLEQLKKGLMQQLLTGKIRTL